MRKKISSDNILVPCRQTYLEASHTHFKVCTNEAKETGNATCMHTYMQPFSASKEVSQMVW